LWKYYEVTYQHIKDWQNNPIKKLNFKKVEQKFEFWQSEAMRLKKSLNDKDAVLQEWLSLLESFKINMKWIGKLSDDVFKVIIITPSYITKFVLSIY
jgi:hypothetical protein